MTGAFHNSKQSIVNTMQQFAYAREKIVALLVA